MLAPARDDGGALLGREVETERLIALLEGIEDGGAALVLRGEPGIGKSRLLAEAVAAARERGIAVLTTTGVQSEARLGFASLHQLLRPVRARATDLPAMHQAALDGAFGLIDGPAPEHFRIAMATLDLLSAVAEETPVLLIAEDAHWLDRPSADVLAFVARRLDSDPIVLLAATRDGYDSPLLAAGLPQHRVDVSTTMRRSRCARQRLTCSPRPFAPASCARPPATRSRSWNCRSRRARTPTTPRLGNCP
jgi:AAA ATPase domain